MAKPTWFLFGCGFAIAACTGAATHRAAPPQSALPATQPTAPAVAQVTPAAALPPLFVTREEAHRLVIATAACWLGSIWLDGKWVDQPGVDEAARVADAERRCHQLIQRVYGRDDPARYERLRAVDPVEVSQLKAKILTAARVDSVDHAREPQLGALLDSMANAERESVLGLRAVQRLNRAVHGRRERTKSSTDEATVIGQLTDARAFEGLLGLEMGDLTPEARAVAILTAVDRMQTARGLTDHLKIYALARPFAVLFGAQAPVLPKAALQPLARGTWLAYITDVAAAAGHPVLPAAKSVADRELLAWGGILEGIADKLRSEAQQMSDATDLKRVVEAVTRRFDAEYLASQKSVLDENKKG